MATKKPAKGVEQVPQSTTDLRFVVRNRDVGGMVRPTRILQQRWMVGHVPEWRDVPEVKED